MINPNEMETEMPPRTRRKPATKPKAVEEEIDELEVDETEEVEEAPKPKRRGRPAKKKPEPVEELDDEDDDEEEEEPAPAPKKRGRPAKKAAKVEDDDEDEDEEEDEKPKAKRTPPKRPEIQFGTAWLATYIQEKTGKEYTSYDLRVLLRKLAKDGILNRDIGTDRARYEFTGPKDPVVAEIIKKVKSGAVEEEKKASLDKLKSKGAKKKAAAPAKKRSAKKPVEEVEEEEFDDEDFDELED